MSHPPASAQSNEPFWPSRKKGGDVFFGEPALNIDDLLQTDTAGYGVINVLSATKLIEHPRVYSTFLLWLLSELFERLPEVGDPVKPKLVFFFDEAHLLFDDAPKVLLEKIEQVVRLIRSKGIGVYFVTQNPMDITSDVLGQLGNRVQHALRAFTEKDRRGLKAVADNFRSDGCIDVMDALTRLGVGEALISFLDEKGSPMPVEVGTVIPPCSRLGILTPEEREALIKSSLVAGQYEKTIDRESAFEMLKNQMAQKSEVAVNSSEGGEKAAKGRRMSTRQSPLEAMAVSAARAVGTQIGRQIIRGILGSVFGGRR